MDWIKARIYTTTDGIDAVTGCLLQIGINGFEIEDANDFNDFLKDTTIHWDYIDEDLMKLSSCETSVIIYLPQNEQGAQQLALAKNELSRLRSIDSDNRFGRLEIELDNVKEEDWANNWKQYFKPFTVGEKFLIKPTWESVDNDFIDKKVLEIDPGSSFGTGQHHTTQLCIEFLEDVVFDGFKVLDMGCGSGILSIASVMLGASNVLGIDIDQNSVKIAKENADVNGISQDKFAAVCGNVLDDLSLREKVLSQKYDVIAANIVADVIIAMKDLFKACLKPGGVLVTSGIIDVRSDDVKNALLDAGFEIAGKKEKKDWVAFLCK